MKYIDEYRDSSLVKPLVEELKKSLTRPVRLMEVCGTHTMAIFRNGIRSILPDGMEIKQRYDTSVFVKGAIAEVYKTLGIAIALVVLWIVLGEIEFLAGGALVASGLAFSLLQTRFGLPADRD